MLKHLKRLLSDTLLFSIITIGTKLVAILFLPFYLRIFSKALFADQDQVNSWTMVLTYLFTLGMDAALAFYYFDTKKQGERRIYLSNAIFLSSLISLIITLVFSFFPAELVSLILTPAGAEQRTTLILACLATGVSVAVQYLLAYARYERRIKLFVSGSISYVAGTNMLCAMLVFFWPKLVVFFAGQLIGPLLVAGVLVYFLRGEVIWYFSKKHLLRLFYYGIPLVPVLLSHWVLSWIPRYILYHAGSKSQAAIYALVLRLASIINLVTAPFFLAWRPFSMSLKDRPDAPVLFALVGKLLLITGTLAIILLQPLLEPLVRLLNPDYIESSLYFWGIALSVLLNVVQSIFGVGLLIKKRQFLSAIGFMIAAPLCGIIGWLIIPKFGIWAAVASNLFAYLFILIFVIYKNQQVWPLKIQPWRLIVYLAVFISCAIEITIVRQFNLAHQWIYYLAMIVVLILAVFALQLIPLKHLERFIELAKSTWHEKKHSLTIASKDQD
ncbi:MAG: hypothetical protein RLZ12_9 [Bacillota bacterium]|jgi:O-antigen/teichoic acid export membrane protein